MPVLDNVATGYGLAWAARWRLLAVLVPVLMPLQVVLLLIDVVSTGDNASIIDGSITFSGVGGLTAFAAWTLIVLCWLFALTAATAAAAGVKASVKAVVKAGADTDPKVGRDAGAEAGPDVSPVRAFKLAAGHLPYLVLGLIAAAGAGFAGIFVAGWLAVGLGVLLGPIVFVASVAGLGLLGARFLFTIPAAIFGGSGWELTRGKVWRTAGAVLLGGVVIPLIADAGLDRITLPVFAELADALLIVVAVAVQAGMLARIYVDNEPSADVAGRLGAVESQLRPRRLVSLGLLVPALAMSIVLVANPYHLTRVDAGGDGPPGGAVSVAWPAGSQPIIVSNGAIRFCGDPLCAETVLRNGGPTVMHDWGAAGIGLSGIVVKASLTGGAESGGPFIHIGRCTRDGDCRGESWIPTRASSDEPFTWPEMAVSSAPDGAVVFALAQSTRADDKPATTDGEVEFKFIRCPDLKCAEPQRFSAGRIKGSLERGPRSQQRARLRIDADGRPTASFWIGHTIQEVTCDAITCANPSITATSAGPPGAPWDRFGSTIVWVNNGILQTSEGLTRQLAQTEFSEQSQAIATSPTGIYVVMAVKAVPPTGFRVTFGDQPQYWQYFLWRCPDLPCADPRRVPLDIVEGHAPAATLAVGQDGHVLVVREDRTLLIPPPT